MGNSSEKATSVAADEAVLVMVNSIVTVPPAPTGSSVKLLVSESNWLDTVSSAVAGGRVTGLPPMVPVRLPVVFE